MHQAEEDLLVLAAQEGNRTALNMLCRRYQKPLLRYAYRLSNDTEIAHDAVQEGWAKLLKNIRKLEDPRALRSWLYQLVRWSSLDILRKQNRRKERESVFDETQLAEAQHDEGLQSKSEIIDTGPSRDLRSSINRLPQIEKQMIQLFYIDELRVAEIAQVLGIPGGTVKSRLNRARKLLKEKYDP